MRHHAGRIVQRCSRSPPRRATKRRRQAAAEIQAARDRANEAADDLFQAQSRPRGAAGRPRRLEAEELELERRRSAQRDVESVALGRFVDSGAGGIPLFTGMQAPKDQVQAEVFVDVLTNNGVDVLDQYDAARHDLAANAEALADQREEIESHEEAFDQLRLDAQAEVVRLREIEEERLQDEAVQQALLEEQQAAARPSRDEQLRRNAEEAAKAQPNPGLGQHHRPGGGAPRGDRRGRRRPGSTANRAGVPTRLPPAAIAAEQRCVGWNERRPNRHGRHRQHRTRHRHRRRVHRQHRLSDRWRGVRRFVGRAAVRRPTHEGVDMLAPVGTPIVAGHERSRDVQAEPARRQCGIARRVQRQPLLLRPLRLATRGRAAGSSRAR